MFEGNCLLKSSSDWYTYNCITCKRIEVENYETSEKKILFSHKNRTSS